MSYIAPIDETKFWLYEILEAKRLFSISKFHGLKKDDLNDPLVSKDHIFSFEWATEKEIKIIDNYFYAENYHQQYLASVGSRQYCSASPTKVKLEDFNGSNYKLKEHIWENFNWEIEKCVLRSDNNPIKNNI